MHAPLKDTTGVPAEGGSRRAGVPSLRAWPRQWLSAAEDVSHDGALRLRTGYFDETEVTKQACGAAKELAGWQRSCVVDRVCLDRWSSRDLAVGECSLDEWPSTPGPRKERAMQRRLSDQTGASSIGAVARERATR